MYFRARHYSPRLGRFVQKDPLFENRAAEHYAYAANNPVFFTDPTGESPIAGVINWLAGGDYRPEISDTAMLGAVTGGLARGTWTGVKNVAAAGAETVKGTVQAIAHPIQTVEAVVDNAAQTIVAFQEQGILPTLERAAGGLAAEAEKDPSKFAAQFGMGAATSVLFPKVFSWAGKALQGTRLGQAVSRLGGKATKAGAGASAEGEAAAAAIRASPEGAGTELIEAQSKALGRAPLRNAAKSADTIAEGMRISPYRVTGPGETFIRYETANPAFSKITPSGGVRPGTFAAPASDGLVPVSQRVPTYNLPSPEIPRPNAVTLTPPAGTPIIGPRPVSGGLGNEVIFWMGY